MSRQDVPQANEAERALIGCLLLSEDHLDSIATRLLPGDFLTLRLGRAFQAMLDLRSAGIPIDVVSVSDALAGHEDPSFLLELMNETPAISRAPHYADMVTEAAQKREALLLASDVIARIKADDDLGGIREGAQTLLSSLNEQGGAAVPLLSPAEYMSLADDSNPEDDWLIPHIVQRRMRTIILAGEGVGKSMVMRQIGLHAAAGRDPFDPSIHIRPVRVLYIDAENQMRTIQRQTRLANRSLDLPWLAGEEFRLWHREDGVDLRSRDGRRELRLVLQQHRPDLVLAGPLYKLFRRGHSEDMEQATIEFCQLIDELRVQFDFAIMFEHHVPKGESQSRRELTPFGSSVLMRWPECGIALNDHGEARNGRAAQLIVDVERYRPDRMPCDWPQTLTRGSFTSNMAWSPAWEYRRGEPIGARYTPSGWIYERAI